MRYCVFYCETGCRWLTDTGVSISATAAALHEAIDCVDRNDRGRPAQLHNNSRTDTLRVPKLAWVSSKR